MRIMHVNAEKCVECGACMEACSTAYFKEKSPELSRVKILNNTGFVSVNICSQCGACMAVCPTQALERDANGVVQLRKEKCTCPAASMSLDGDPPTAPSLCTACGIPARNGPTGALELINVPAKA